VEGVAAQQRKMGRETIAKAFLENEAFSLSPRRASISNPKPNFNVCP
jgi:hypothetical protein